MGLFSSSSSKASVRNQQVGVAGSGTGISGDYRNAAVAASGGISLSNIGQQRQTLKGKAAAKAKAGTAGTGTGGGGDIYDNSTNVSIVSHDADAIAAIQNISLAALTTNQNASLASLAALQHASEAALSLANHAQQDNAHVAAQGIQAGENFGALYADPSIAGDIVTPTLSGQSLPLKRLAVYAAAGVVVYLVYKHFR